MKKHTTDKTRKVRAGWYTVTVYDFQDVLEGRAAWELHFDVWKTEMGDWNISYRRDIKLETGSFHFIANLDKAKEAKAYAVALAKAAEQNVDMPQAKEFSDYTVTAYRFKNLNDWHDIVIGGKE